VKSSDHLFQVGKIWYAWVYQDLGGGRRKRIRKSTGCTDKKAALAVLSGWERKAADPSGAAKTAATLKQAFELLERATLAKATAKTPTRSMETRGFHAKQAKGWLLFAGMMLARSVGKPEGLSRARKRELRTLGESFPLERFGPGFVDAFVDWRRACGAVSEGTIGKDLSVMRPAMRCALRAGLWAGSLEMTFPKHELNYTPTDRWHDAAELELLRAELLPERFAVVAYAYALGAERQACKRALKADLADEAARFVHVRGTKKKTRDRWVPVLFEWQRELLAHVRSRAKGDKDGKLFHPSTWDNLRRQLASACEKAGIAPASLTSMRHSFAHRMKAEGIRQEDLAVAMGHRDTKMLDAIYARASTPKELAERFEHAAAERRAALVLIKGGKADDKTPRSA
jgi:hypothetical protein